MINKIIKENNLKPLKYIKKGKSTIIETKDEKYVIKICQINPEIINYLKSRSFNYFPKIIKLNNYYLITKFVDDISYPIEQKLNDLIKLVALLHSKTNYYKEVNLDYYKKIYENIHDNILYLESFYNDLIKTIETKIFMNSYEYLLARNISTVFNSLSFCKKELKNWHDIVKNETKCRFVVIHNNLNIENFIFNDNPYLISWDKSKIDLPIFDLYKIIKKYILNYDMSELLKIYEQIYPLKSYEKKLFFIMLAMPPKINIHNNIYEMTKMLTKEFDIMFKIEKLISPYYLKQDKQNN